MDETGNTGRNLRDPNQPIHLILTLLIEEAQVATVHEHIRDVAREHCPAGCRNDDFEFHGQDLFAARGYFSGMSPAERIGIFDDVLRGIELSGAEVIVRGVEKSGLRERYASPFHPHDIALMFTIGASRPRQLPGARYVLGLEPGADRPHCGHDPLRAVAP